jgi:hypothetical protein
MLCHSAHAAMFSRLIASSVKPPVNPLRSRDPFLYHGLHLRCIYLISFCYFTTGSISACPVRIRLASAISLTLRIMALYCA